MIKLQVYIADECWTCEETHHIVADVARHFPEVAVELLNIHNSQRPDQVFAVPTYLLDGRVIFLGNPTRDQLKQKLVAALQTVEA